MAKTKAMKTSEIACSLEDLRSELECLLVELESHEIRSDYDHICDLEKKGQQILNTWVKRNFPLVGDGYHLAAGKFGNASQFGFYFKEFKFQLDPLKENQDSYRWYVRFGKEYDGNFFVLASLGFNP